MLTCPAIQNTLSSKTAIEMMSAAAAAAVVAAWVTALPSVPAQIDAHSNTLGATVDRIDIGQPVPKCSQQAWPYYERSCLRDRDQPAGEMRTVRIVPIDRTQTANLTAAVAK